MTQLGRGDDGQVEIVGGTDGTVIGNTGNRMLADVIVSSAPTFNVVAQDSAQYYCDNNQLYSLGLNLNMANASTDNPLVLFRNPLNSTKQLFIWRIQCGLPTTNVAAEFKLFSNPTLSTTVATITNITQQSLSTTVTVTTATPHNATVGATATIAGTVNFNGSYTVTAVTSSTIYTFTKTPAPLLTITELTGTSTSQSSLGTDQTVYPRNVGNSQPASSALLNTLPTVSNNGSPLSFLNVGQNTTSVVFVDDLSICLQPGNSCLLTGSPTSNNRSASMTFTWAEVSL